MALLDFLKQKVTETVSSQGTNLFNYLAQKSKEAEEQVKKTVAPTKIFPIQAKPIPQKTTISSASAQKTATGQVIPGKGEWVKQGGQWTWIPEVKKKEQLGPTITKLKQPLFKQQETEEQKLTNSFIQSGFDPSRAKELAANAIRVKDIKTAGQPQLSPEEWRKQALQNQLAGAKMLGRDIAGFTRDIAVAPSRTIASFGLEPAAGIIGLATGKEVPAIFTPQGKLQETLLGKEPIVGPFETMKKAPETGAQIAKATGLPISEEKARMFSTALAPFLVGGSTVLDVTPFGGPGKQVSKQVIKQLEKKLGKEIAEQVVKKGAEFATEVASKPASLNLVKSVGVEDAFKVFPTSKELAATKATQVKPILKTQEQIPSVLEEQVSKKGQRLLDKTQSATQRTITVLQKPPQEIPKIAQIFDKSKLKPSYDLNIKHFNIAETNKTAITGEVDNLKNKINEKVGTILSNDEAIAMADKSSDILTRTIGRDATLEYNSRMLKLRQRIADAANSGRVDKQFIDDLLTLKTQGADLGRKLQALSIGADPKNITAKQSILDAILDVTDNADEVLKAAEGVDFNDFGQAAAFYRQFIHPKAEEWIDLLRYSSMLSSPLTHIVNITSNAINSALVAPIEKLVNAGVDIFSSAILGKERQFFAGEAGQYLKGYFGNIKEATNRFAGVMRGKRAYTQLDIKQIPVAVKGMKGKIATTLSVPMRMLEGMDQFFTALSESGEKAALTYAKSKGANIKNIDIKASEKAMYRLFRQDILPEGQGGVLNALDHITNTLFQLRNSNSKIVRTISKFTLPFVKTPANILKQGIEYSPIGFTTIIGAKNKTEQISRAIIGTAAAIGVATLLASNRLTFSAPTTDKEKTLWKQAGKEPYSIKIGNNWVSYQKLPPALAFNFAFISAVDEAFKNKKISESNVDILLTSLSSIGQFISDQSYLKSIGDLLAAIKGDTYAASKLVSNYPQQLIPFKSFSGWLNRLIDEYQRMPNKDEDFLTKQLQYFMMNVPGLSQQVPIRKTEEGDLIKQQKRIFNALSPFRVSEMNKELDKYLNDYESLKKEAKEASDRKAQEKINFKPRYDEIKNMVDEEEAQRQLDSLTEDEYKLYKSLKTSDKSRMTGQEEIRMYDTVKQIQQLVESGKDDEVDKIINDMSDEDYRIYKLVKNKLGLEY